MPGNRGCQSRKAMEVEYESTNSGCFGAFERRRETSKRRIERWSRQEEQSRTYREISDKRAAEGARLSMGVYESVISECYDARGRRRGEPLTTARNANVALEGANGHIVRCHMENRRLQQDGVFGTKAHLERVLKSQRDRRLRVEKAAVTIQAFLRTTVE